MNGYGYGYGGPAEYAMQQEQQQRQNIQNIINMFLQMRQYKNEQEMRERDRQYQQSQDLWQRGMTEKKFGADEAERLSRESQRAEDVSFRERQAARPSQEEETYARVKGGLEGGLRAMGMNPPPGLAGQEIRAMKGQPTWAEKQAEAEADLKRDLVRTKAQGEQQRQTWGVRDESKADPMTKARIDAINKTLAMYSTRKNTIEKSKGDLSPYDKNRVALVADYDNKLAKLEAMEKDLIAKRDVLLYPSLDSRVKEFISKNPEYTYEEASEILQEMLTNPRK